MLHIKLSDEIYNAGVPYTLFITALRPNRMDSKVHYIVYEIRYLQCLDVEQKWKKI